MSMTFDEYIEKRVNQAVEEAVHKVSVNFANNIWNHGVHDLGQHRTINASLP